MNNEETAVFLEQVAEALRASGRDAEFWNPERCPMPRLCVFSPIIEDWDGLTEHPALAFAVLDILDRLVAPCDMILRHCHGIGEDWFWCGAEGAFDGQPSDMRHVATGKTRTEAICRALIAAHKASLLSQGGEA